MVKMMKVLVRIQMASSASSTKGVVWPACCVRQDSEPPVATEASVDKASVRRLAVPSCMVEPCVHVLRGNIHGPCGAIYHHQLS